MINDILDLPNIDENDNIINHFRYEDIIALQKEDSKYNDSNNSSLEDNGHLEECLLLFLYVCFAILICCIGYIADRINLIERR